MPNPNGNPSSLKPWGPNNPPPKSPGHPRKLPQSEANDARLRMECDEDVRRVMKLAKGSTWSDAIACSLARRAVRGDVAAAKELRESVEGRSVQRVELSRTEDGTPEFVVVYATQIPGARTIDVQPEKELPPGAPADDETL